MARPLRTEFTGAIYHVMSRGNARQVVFRDERDYQRMVDGLEQTVTRFGCELLSFVLMPNHFHLFLRTPHRNLSRGMQYLVSGYTNWHASQPDGSCSCQFNNSSCDCDHWLAMGNDGTWYDRDDGTTRPYVCEAVAR